MSKLERLIQQYCPDGVEWKMFYDVCDLVRGITYNKGQEAKASTEDSHKVLRANNITLNLNTLNFDDVKLVSKDVVVKPEQHLHTGDILMCAGSGSKEHVGKVAFISDNIDYTFGGFMAVVRCNALILPKYMFHILTSHYFSNHLDVQINSSTINNINKQVMQSFAFPLPPLPVQEEIVRILDAFTELQAELQAELQKRKQQYNFYRDILLSNMGNNAEYLTISEFAELKAGKAIKATELSSIMDDNHSHPCFGGNGIRGFIGKVSHIGDYAIIGRQGALCGCVNWASGKFYATEHAVVCTPRPNVSSRYLYHLFTVADLNQYKSQGAQPGLSVQRLNELVFPIPPLEEQNRIVSILDRFDTLTNDLTSGLPAEMEKRRQQYEYYRDRLLTFKRKEA